MSANISKPFGDVKEPNQKTLVVCWPDSKGLQQELVRHEYKDGILIGEIEGNETPYKIDLHSRIESQGKMCVAHKFKSKNGEIELTLNC